MAEHGGILNDDEKVNYVVQELVGLSFLERIIDDERVTDVGFNGTDLIVEGNGFKKYKVTDLDISEDRIIKLIAKFSNATGTELTPRDPILNSSMKHLRLNAVHKQNAPFGTTMAARVSRRQMALTEDNFVECGFAPSYVLDLLRAMIETRCNMGIAGETGTGKTELQKLLMSFIPFEERFITIESVIEFYAKELLPDKDVYSWLATENVSIEELIKAALRNHPVWIIIGETLGQEAYEMMQAVLSGHHIFTTLHAVDARAIPQRLLNMAKMGYRIDESSFIDNVYRYFQFGLFIKKRNGVRYLSEIVEYHNDQTATTVFKQIETKDGLIQEIGELSEEFKQRLIEFDSDYKGMPTSFATEGVF